MSVISNNQLAGASGQGGSGYEISRSVRFNSSDSAYCSFTPASAGNRKTWTWAGWVKQNQVGLGVVFGAGSGDRGELRIYDGGITFYEYDGSNYYFNLRNNDIKLRDPSAWMHVVIAFDSTQATASNRTKAYINGDLITWTTNTSFPSQNFDCVFWNNSNVHYLGRGGFGRYWNGYLTDVYFIDGQALDPTSFGEFDDNGIWQPKAYTGSYGTNGFHLDFSDNSTAAALGTDTSGAGNDWSVNNISVTELYSVAFDGSTNTSLSIPSGASISGTGDFTVEFWHKPTSFASNYRIPYANDTAGGISIGLNSTGTMFYGRSGLTIEGTTSNTVNFGQYNHFALTRSGGTFRMFINGTQGYSGSPSINYNSGNVRIGKDGLGSLEYVGEISSLRSISGTALYTANFTAPARPLSAVSGTTLLTCQSSTLVDQSANNFTVTAVGNAHVFSNGSDIDSLVDVPTNGTETDTGVGGEVRGNYATLNPLHTSGMNSGTGAAVLSNGNLEATSNTSAYKNNFGTIVFPAAGKYYFEVTVLSNNGTNNQTAGIAAIEGTTKKYLLDCFAASSTSKRSLVDGSATSLSGSFNVGDVIGVAVDCDAGTAVIKHNNTDIDSGYTLASGVTYAPFFSGYNCGTSAFNFGQRAWVYSAPSNHKALCTTNLPDPTIADGSTSMDVVTYTGNGSSLTISGLSFSPDFAWFKNRATNKDPRITDIIRGTGVELYPSSTSGDFSQPQGVTAFNSDGVSVGSDGGYNGSSQAMVLWAWDAGSSTVSNTDGSITSSVRANPSAGFSIVSYTGPGSSATIGHGLNAAPEFIIAKNRDYTDPWAIYHVATGANKLVYLDTSAASTVSGYWGSGPTSSVFGIGNYNGVARSSDEFIAYCFAPVDGYSSFGSYVGNGSSDGAFVYTGFRPRWVMIKSINSLGDWIVWDTARDTYNVSKSLLYPNTSGAEQDGIADRSPDVIIDILSNGFKCRETNNDYNGSEPYIYAAFAENPFALNARAR